MAERLRGQSNLRAVFIRDCKALADLPVRTMQAALIAFAESDEACDKLKQLTSQEQLVRFCESQPEGTMAFLLDDFTALPLFLRANVSNEQQNAMLFLRQCSSIHYQVQVTSINDNNKEDILNHSVPVAIVSFCGGMTTVSSPPTHACSHRAGERL